jgi:hypothetical protein
MNDAYAQTAHLAQPASREAARPRREEASPFLPLLLMGTALLGWLAFQSYELMKDHRGLEQAFAAQQPQVARAGRLRNSLSSLASDTQRLADTGDAGAQVIVSQLRKRGITIHPGAAAPSRP